MLPRRIRVRVQQDHIDHSKRQDSHHCMIADAIKKVVPSAEYLHVDLQSIRWSNRLTGKRYTFLTPPVAQRNLLRFDQGDPNIEPFAFTLTEPMVRDIGWCGQRSPGASRVGKTYRKTGRKRSIVYVKEREFGLRKWIERT